MSISLSARRGVALALLGSALVAALAFNSNATATVQTKFYSVSPATGTVTGLIPSSVTVVLKNSGPGGSQPSTQSFGSAELIFGSMPASDVVQPITSPLSNGWTAALLPTNPATVKLSSPGVAPVAPGSSVSVTLMITAPISPSTFTIGTVVKQSNDFSGNPGNNFLHVTGNTDPIITVVPPPVTLTFATNPPALLQQSPSPTGVYSYMCPVVHANATGYPNVPVPGIQVTIQHKGASDPGLLLGTTPIEQTTVATDPAGNATFGNPACTTGIGATNVGSGYVLEATSASAQTPADSTAFTVDPIVCNVTCTVTTSDGGINAKEVATGSGLFGLTAAFAPGQTLSCDSSVSTLPPDPFVETASTDGVSGTITLTFPKSIMNSVPNNGAPHMPVCAGAGKESAFPGSTLVDPTAPGYSLFPIQGLLLDCSDPVYQADILEMQTNPTPPPDSIPVYPLQMCVSSRARTPGGGEMVVITTNSLSDPRQF